MVLTYFGLGHLTLCCSQTNILPNWLVTSTLQCLPLHHKMSSYGGMFSDILTVWISDKPPFQQHWNDTSNHNPFTVLMKCLMFKAVTDLYVYMYIYKSEYKCQWAKEINIKDLPILPPVTHYEHHFCFHDMYFTMANMFSKGFFSHC